MQHLFFKSQINRNQIQNYIQSFKPQQFAQQLLLQIKQSTNILHSFIKHGSTEEVNFFRNYEILISLIYEKAIKQSLNFSLHWINVYGQRLIEVNKIKEAIEIFECSLNYIETQNIDKLLLTTALSNLSVLYQRKKNWKQSLNVLIQSIDICISSIKDLNKQELTSEKKYIQAFAIILANSFRHGKSVISNILKESIYQQSKEETKYQTNDKQLTFQQKGQLLDMKLNFNKLGFETCVSYLGKRSYFIQFFDPIQNQIHKLQNIDTQTQEQQTQMISINQETFRTFESAMMSRLESIETILKQKQTISNFDKYSEPKQLQIVSTTNQHEDPQDIEQKNQQIQQNLPIGDLASGIFSFFAKGSTLDQECFQLKGWNVQIQFIKLFGQSLGKLQFRCNHLHKKLSYLHKIGQKQLEKILILTNLEDTMPYQHSIQDLPSNFITICIKPYFSITQEGQIEFFPKSKGVTNQFLETKFLGCRCYWSLNHLKGSSFRIGISPIDEAGSIYLNVELTQQTLEDFFQQLIDPIPTKIKQLYEISFMSKKQKNKQKKLSTNKSIILKQRQNFIKIIQLLIKGFQQFIISEQNLFGDKDIFGIIQKEDIYFKYYQIKQNFNGIFFRLNYMSKLKQFCIYAEQCHIKNQKDFNVKRKINGQSIFGQNQFEDVFGFKLNQNCLKQKLKRVQEIICQKYLLNFKRSSQNLVKDSYQFSFGENNCMMEKSFNFHSFYVDFIPKAQDNNYLCPITASIVTISNNFPIGIKVNYYDPDTITSKGYFINICPQDWRFENIFQQKGQVVRGKNICQNVKQNIDMFKKYSEQYGCSQNYFLTDWMQNEGFKRLLSKVVNKSSPLYLQKNLSSIVNWTKMFQQ